MDKERIGGWVYIMADRYRGAMYVGVTSHLAARIHQHRNDRGSDFCARYGLKRLVWAERGDRIEDCITHEKRLKRWRREFKFDLIERGNPDWLDLHNVIVGWFERRKSGTPGRARGDGMDDARKYQRPQWGRVWNGSL
jgi:putative endonuclease